MKNYFIYSDGSEYSKSDFENILMKKCSEAVFSDFPENTGNIGFIAGMLNAFRLGLSNEDIDFKLFRKWTDFNKKVIEGKNIRSVYGEDCATVINSLVWLLAFETAESIVFSADPTVADMAIVSLSSLADGNISLSDYKCVISTGIDRVDFNAIKGSCSDVLWINYYGLPYCYCVSYSQDTDISGDSGKFHQIKPVAGFSVFVADENGSAVPSNVTGKLAQKSGEDFIITKFSAVFLTDGRLVACGTTDGNIYISGKIREKSVLEDKLLRSGRVQDCELIGNVMYYTQKMNYNRFQIEEILNINDSKELEFREVPYIPYDSAGRCDTERLSALTDEVYDKLNMINNVLGESYGSDFYCHVEYENKSESILSHKTEHNTNVISSSVNISEEPAIITAPPIDYSKCLYKNLSEIIRGAADSNQKIVYINSEGKSEQTYRELYKESLEFAEGLRSVGIREGDTLIFQIPDNREFIVAFWACILIGAVTAPLGVLDDYGNNNLNTEKLYNIFRLLENAYVLSYDGISEPIKKMLNTDRVIKYGNIKSLETSEPHEELNHVWHDDEICLMLFTSGSTGIPKGVGLSQKNVFARTMGEIEMYGLDSTLSDFNWMTLTHAAGIIWSHIRDTYLKAFQVQADTNTILKNPLSYFDYMSEYKSTTSWAPNFAYALLAKTIDESKDYGWNLSYATNIYSGGEANVSASLREFLRKTAKYGMSSKALIPAFGMTETSSCMTYYNGFSLDTSSDDDRFIPIGEPSISHTVRIADENGNVVRKGETGRIEYKGDTITQGYYKNPEANAESFTSDGFFITGDMGYIEGKNVVLTGRIKEMIIVNGLNYYVQDIESIVDETKGVVTSYTTALSVKNSSGTEDILIVFTPLKESMSGEEIRKLTSVIRDTVMKKSGLYAKYIVPDFKTNSLRTEIGKKQRSKYRTNFYEGKYDDILREIGVIKDNPYIMEECRARAELKGHMSDEPFAMLKDGNIPDNIRYFIDEYAVENAGSEISAYISGILERGRLWNSLPAGTKILLPVISSVDNEDFSLDFSLMSGFVKSFNIENPDKKCVVVEFDVYDRNTAKKELLSPSAVSEVCYRNGKRYIKELKTVLPQRTDEKYEDIISGKNILVAGGLGGVGINISRHLLSKYGASLLILGRSDADKEKLNLLEKISDSADRVMYIKADVSDERQISEAVRKYTDVTGNNIDTIINLTGIIRCADGSSFWTDIDSHKIANESSDNFEYIINSKLLTTISLRKFAEKNNITGFIMFGSVNGIQGGSGLSAYAAANSFQARYAEYLNSTSDMKAYCINWSGWYGTGMSRDIPDYIVNVSQTSGFRFTSTEENLAYFDAVVKNDIRNVIVGIDRDNSRNKVETNDKYSPKISIYYTGHDADINNIVSGIRDNCAVSYLKTSKIFRNSLNIDDVNLTELKRNVISEKQTTSEMSAEEKQMVEVWKSVLGVSSVGAEDNFFELGGNSMLLTKLTYEISEQLGINIPIQDIMLCGSVRKLVGHIGKHDSSSRISQIEEKKKRVSDDISLEEYLIGDISKRSEEKGRENVLVIGNSDIKCIFTLAELAESDKCENIYFLCNYADDSEAYSEVNRLFSSYELDSAVLIEKINIISGDFANTNFGLSPDKYKELCRNISTVYYFGINMNLVSSYESLSMENITGTKNVIAFCCTVSAKKLIFISSLAVFKTVSEDSEEKFSENTEINIDMLRNMSNRDYLYSVYASDRIAQLAHERGVDVRLIRCPRVCGSSENGFINSDDIIWLIIRYMIRNGLLPEFSLSQEFMMPVDILAEQITGLAQLERSDKYIFHLKGTEADSCEIIDWVKTKCADLRNVTMDEWNNLIRTEPEYNDGAVSSMLGHLNVNSDEDKKCVYIDDSATLQIMMKNNIASGKDMSIEDLLDNTYRYLKKIHYFDN